MSGSVTSCWKCGQNTWAGKPCEHCGAPEVPPPEPCERCGAGVWAGLFLGKRLCLDCLAAAPVRHRRVLEKIRRRYDPEGKASSARGLQPGGAKEGRAAG